MAAEEDIDFPALKSQLNQTQTNWNQEMERSQSQVDALQQKLTEVKACIQGSEADAKKELNVLWRRPESWQFLIWLIRLVVSKQLDGVGLVDKNGIPLSGWSRNVDISSFESADEETWTALSSEEGSLDEQDGVYISELLKSVQMVTDVMESLVKRIIMAESETAIEKQKVTVGQEEIKKKAVQIENMSIKLEEMEQFAMGTNSILNEMRQRVEDLVEETSRQRQRAAENEQELCRVKQDFESLKSYVSTLISVRETLLSSEKQFQTIEKHFERSVFLTSIISSSFWNS
ncbi:UNVERIFIED_CONTAM: hypothetical protein Sradi_4191700 [Sesamum radiatum]|uniref:Uncharacterized protein n=1 Tax=Sesamum radiatum TaxID=300843 RepID=A0AAW2P5J5_SESRA